MTVLIAIDTVDLELRPYKIGILSCFDLVPPNPSLHQTPHQHCVVSWSNEVSRPHDNCLFLLDDSSVQNDKRIENSMRKVD